jgi:ABC-type nitrate/sulfonate/bicarbonate transport system substrate-binding protein
MKASKLISMRAPVKTLFIFPVFFFVLPLAVQAQTSTGLKKVRIAVPSFSSSQMPPFVAKELGYYRQEGLEAEIILMRAGLAVQASVAGSIDYTGAPGSVVAAAVQGANVRVVMAYANKPLYDLVVRPEITTYAQLKGKVLGLGALGGFSIEIPRIMLSKNGLDPRRDLTMILIGSTPDRFAALRANTIQATLLEPSYNFMAYKDGFRKLGYSGDYFETLQGALTTSERKLRTETDEVRRFTRATVRGFLAYRNHKDIAVPILRKVLRIEDEKMAEQVYSYTVGSLTADGTLSEELMRTIIEQQRHASGATRAVASDEVFDFSVVRAVMNEVAGKNPGRQ